MPDHPVEAPGADLAAIRTEASHHERGHNVLNDKQCGICQEPWPCLVARLDKGLDAQAERLAQLNQALEVSAAMYERDVPRLEADLAEARSALAEAEQYHDRSVRESALELFEARAEAAEQRGRAERAENVANELRAALQIEHEDGCWALDRVAPSDPAS